MIQSTQKLNSPLQLQGLLQKLRSVHPSFFVSMILTGVMGIFFVAGIFLDSRYITGAPAWVKPTKFAISVVVYIFTLLWMMSFMDQRKRLVRFLGWVILIMFWSEFIGIVTQVIRGTTSHYNISTPLDTILFTGLMAIPIVILLIANIVMAFLLLLQRFENPAIAWGIRLGITITIIGMAQGFLMTQPTAQQMAGWQNGEPVRIVGAHSVGVEDGGPGLPGLNWSTVGGDLRIGHFVGMHALQVLPFVAWFISRQRKLSKRQQVGLVWTTGLGYLGIVALVTWQALRAQSIVSPDVLTASVFAGIVAAVLLAAFVITRSSPKLAAS
jgi:hypothetical protein